MIAWRIVFAALLAPAAAAWAQQSPASQAPDSCLECHLNLEDELGRPARSFENDIHRENGYSCADCHGGDPAEFDLEASMSPAKGFVGKVDRSKIPQLCARCHSDVALMHGFNPRQRTDHLAQYQTSLHGKRLASGDLRVATCIDCHSVHDIREVRHPLAPTHPRNLPETCARCHADAGQMKPYGISTDQLEKYSRSVHWQAVSERGDLSAPTCATCHGNHGAAPPGVSDISHICGTCHVVFQNLFEQSPHQPAFEAMGMSACVTCHGNHDVAPATTRLLGTSDGAICVNCHTDGDAGWAIAARMKERIETLREALDESEEILARAEQSGMEVSAGRIKWNDAHEQWIMARVNVHGFQVGPVDESVETGLEAARGSYQAGVNALEERDYRRKGLAWSLVTIVVTMFGLWLVIRSLESGSGRLLKR